MRLKYYLRGLGLGIAVTATIMSISATRNKGTMTDAQIMARARELGMVDGVLTEIPDTDADSGEAVPTDEDMPKGEGEGAPEETTELSSDESPLVPEGEAEERTDSSESGEASGNSAGENSPGQAENGDGQSGRQEEKKTDDAPGDISSAGTSGGKVSSSSVIVAIYPGESSYMVSRKLATLGLVESADIYDGFLCQNGYDKKLCTGNYEIKAGATAEEIARIITKNQ